MLKNICEFKLINFIELFHLTLDGQNRIFMTIKKVYFYYWFYSVIINISTLIISVFWPLKMSILSRRSVATTAHMRPAKFDFLLFKHIFNIYNNNYLNFSKFFYIKSDFDSKMKIKI